MNTITFKNLSRDECALYADDLTSTGLIFPPIPNRKSISMVAEYLIIIAAL